MAASSWHQGWDITEEEREVYRKRSQASSRAKAKAVRGEGRTPLHPINVPRLNPDNLMPQLANNGLRSLSLFSGGGGLDLGFDRAHNEKDLAIFEMLPQGGKYMDLPEELRRYRDDIFEDKYKRLKWDEPSWTLTAHMRKDCLAYIHPTQVRSISVREAARLQSFPDDFVFYAPMTRMFELVGNSVPPLLAEAIARPIVEQVQAYYTSL